MTKRHIYIILSAVLSAALFFTGCAKVTDSADTGSTTNDSTGTASTVQSAVAQPSFSVSGGAVTSGTVITITSSTSGAKIVWSTDSALTDKNYEVLVNSGKATVSSTVTITQACSIYAVAAKDGWKTSAVRSAVFTIQSSALASAGENTALYLGNPSGAVPDVSSDENYLLEHTNAKYAMSYNNKKHGPNWVAWHLGKTDIGSVNRSDTFTADTSLPSGWYRVTESDFQYTAYGFDRGHMCPSADRTAAAAANEETFFMSNMVPQSAANNQKVWADFENHIRGLVTGSGKEAYIVCGQYGTGGTSAKGTFNTITVASGGSTYSINVPAYTWKIVLYLDEGSDDMNRITSATKVEAIMVPNNETCDDNNKTYTSYLVTVDNIEEKTKYNFFSKLSESLQASLED